MTTDAVNARMESLGFKQIKILRKIGSGGDSAAVKGRQPAIRTEVCHFSRDGLLMEARSRRNLSAAASKEMIDLRKKSRCICHQPSMSDLLAASMAHWIISEFFGIIYTKKGKIAMAITCDDMPDSNLGRQPLPTSYVRTLGDPHRGHTAGTRTETQFGRRW